MRPPRPPAPGGPHGRGRRGPAAVAQVGAFVLLVDVPAERGRAGARGTDRVRRPGDDAPERPATPGGLGAGAEPEPSTETGAPGRVATQEATADGQVPAEDASIRPPPSPEPDEGRGPLPPPSAERVERARDLLAKAIDLGRSTPPPGIGRMPLGARVDKYFGTKLPPVCARLGCYVSDDGKRFYCINPVCQKHKKRETKHTRLGRPEKPRFAYFRCPKCESRDIGMHVLSNAYSCKACLHVWKR